MEAHTASNNLCFSVSFLTVAGNIIFLAGENTILAGLF
jgi:hypothetical protein